MGHPGLASEPSETEPAGASGEELVEYSAESIENLLIDDEGASPTRKRLIMAARLLVSAGMLAFLLYKVEQEGIDKLVPTWDAASTAWLAGAVLFTLLSIVLSAMRWQAVLRALGQRLGFRRLLSLYLAGQFVANVLPTSIGGDVLRVTRTSRDTGQSHTAFASVVLERMTGWIVLPLLTFVGLATNPGLWGVSPSTGIAIAVAVATLVLLGVVLYLVGRHDYTTDFDEEKGWRRFLAAVSFGLHKLRHHPAQVLNVIGVGFAFQLTLVVAAFMGARALNLNSAVGITALLAYLPAVLVAQVLPVSISGLGIREGLLVVMLRPLGVPRGQAIALGLMLFFLNLVVSLLGAPSFAVGHKAKEVPA